ncbi:lipoate--protein ligase family protein [Paenibacillus sp.]|jgi:octanoyl-[GcvH]:protein N-octanoyltransferase|uniref:lipoate--protein ligase family protein n=1 Tax=Paenibacillus sp. TaxID=58172 RepID=UPI00282D19CB|nr:lipoate--protein ligase family protein [Paenibacillus sp.]MDR0270387.1 lipoate--protein ligase family protein [Paenibacillus sp.]
MSELSNDAFGSMLILDRMNDDTQRDALYPFALDELLCKETGRGGPPLCHIWRHPRSFIIGLRDSRLPGAAEACAWLESMGYATAIRNSGGAAVPLDLGVVNLSLIMPKQGTGDERFRGDFERMYGLIRDALAHTGFAVDKGEITGAYCPGDFDLSIAGQKFCGIAQRRQAHAFVVQAFVIAEGSGPKRAQLVRDFYDRAAQGADAADFPLVEGTSTASLEELTGIGPHAAVNFAEAVKSIIRSRQTAEGVAASAARLTLPGTREVMEMAEHLRQRYTPK